MFRPYIPTLRCWYDNHMDVQFEIVKFFIDEQHVWEELVQETFPRTPHILKQLQERINGTCF